MNRKLFIEERLNYFVIVKTPLFYNSNLFKGNSINIKKMKGGENNCYFSL